MKVQDILSGLRNGSINKHEFSPVYFEFGDHVVNVNNSSDLYFKMLDEILLSFGADASNMINNGMNNTIFSQDICYNGDGSVRNVLLSNVSQKFGVDIRAYYPRNIPNYFSILVKIIDIMNINFDIIVGYNLVDKRSHASVPKNFVNKEDKCIPVFDEDLFMDLGFSNYDCMIVEDKHIQNHVAHILGNVRSISDKKRAEIKSLIRAY
jgi:hypothetical protein